MLFRTLWPFTAGATGATLSTRATRATRATLSTATFTTSAGPTSRPTTAASRTARPAPHPVNLFRELGQLTTVELAIAIGVKLHRMLDKPLGRGWSAWSAAAWSAAAWSAAAWSATTWTHTALTAARPCSTLAGPARPPAFAISSGAVGRTAVGISFRPLGRLGHRDGHQRGRDHRHGRHSCDSRYPSHHRLLEKRGAHFTQICLVTFNGNCGHRLRSARRGLHSRYSFDQVLKRSPRFTRAASSRITSGVRRMTRVVP